MGTSIKKVVGLTERTHPHSWFMNDQQRARFNLAGQVAGSYDGQYKPEQQPEIPYRDPMADAAGARDRIRRFARKAQGLASTIRAGSLEVPSSGQPKQLMGS